MERKISCHLSAQHHTWWPFSPGLNVQTTGPLLCTVVCLTQDKHDQAVTQRQTADKRLVQFKAVGHKASHGKRPETLKKVSKISVQPQLRMESLSIVLWVWSHPSLMVSDLGQCPSCPISSSYAFNCGCSPETAYSHWSHVPIDHFSLKSSR